MNEPESAKNNGPKRAKRNKPTSAENSRPKRAKKNEPESVERNKPKSVEENEPKSAEEKALKTGEILEAILYRLDMGTLLHAQRVSKFWFNAIKDSPPLQRALFFEPINEPTNSTLLASDGLPSQRSSTSPSEPELVLNPLLAKHLQAGDFDIDKMTWSPIVDYVEGRSAGWAEQKQNAFWYENASWRRMFVSQPATVKPSILSCLQDDPDSLRLRSPKSANFKSANFGTAYETIESIIRKHFPKSILERFRLRSEFRPDGSHYRFDVAWGSKQLARVVPNTHRWCVTRADAGDYPICKKAIVFLVHII